MTALLAVAAFAGALVGSATGFGFALVVSPVAFAVLDPLEAVWTMLVLSLVLNALMLFEGGLPRHVDWPALGPLLAAALPGLAAGIAVLDLLPKRALQVGVGVAVIAVAARQLYTRSREAPPRRPRRGETLGAGFATGLLTTSLSVSGPPLVLWLEDRGVRPAEFRTTLAACFLALSIAGGAVLLVAEGESKLELGELPLLLGLVVAGYLAGAYAFRQLEHERFFALALVLVIATGTASLVAGLVGA